MTIIHALPRVLCTRSRRYTCDGTVASSIFYSRFFSIVIVYRTNGHIRYKFFTIITLDSWQFRPTQKCSKLIAIHLWLAPSFWPRVPSESLFHTLLLNFGFGPLVVAEQPLMASAASSQFFSSHLDDNSTWQFERSPRVMRKLLHTYTCHKYVSASRVSIGL